MNLGLEYSDQNLIEKSQQGDQEAFSKLIRKYSSIVYAKSMLLTRNSHDAEDLTQETFVKAFRNIRSVREGASFGPWLLTINRNMAFTRYRKSVQENKAGPQLSLSNENLAEPQDPNDSEDFFIEMDASVIREKILDAIDTLPEQYRLPILLHYMEGLSYKDIQSKLDMSKATLKGLITRGVGKLRSLLKQMKVAI